MPYSAVSQPLPLPTRKSGTFGSTQQVQSTVVRPRLHQHAAGGVAGVLALERERAELVGLAGVRGGA